MYLGLRMPKQNNGSVKFFKTWHLFGEKWLVNKNKYNEPFQGTRHTLYLKPLDTKKKNKDIIMFTVSIILW